MRYTTIVDISEFSSLYRNKNVRLVYLHLCLRSGYHDTDRDLIDISVRQLAGAVDLSVSAVRHALRVLQDTNMLKREGMLWHVRKFIIEQEITPRAKTEREAKRKREERARESEREAIDKRLESERAERERMANEGTDSVIIYYEENVRKARNGDADALRVCRNRRELYLKSCEHFGRKPLDI